MAVQAQYPLTKAFGARNEAWEELQQSPSRVPSVLLSYTSYAAQQQQQLVNGTVLSDPGSELTCNLSASRKRTRPEPTSALHTPQQQIMDHLGLSGLHKLPDQALSSVLSLKQTRLMDSATSTSGRSTHLVTTAASAAQDVAVCFRKETHEMEELVRLQSERLLNGLEEVRKRHCRSLLVAVEQRAAARLREKEAELQIASRRLAELEEKVRQMSAETQVWFSLAKNHEAMASSLRAALDHLFLSGNAGTGAAEEGYGDSADDAASSCYPGDNEEILRRKGVCRVCRKAGATVLLLPCRHLGLCRECESKTDSCPVCHSGKSASLQISIP